MNHYDDIPGPRLVYVLRNDQGEAIYVGKTNDVARRVYEHRRIPFSPGRSPYAELATPQSPDHAPSVAAGPRGRDTSSVAGHSSP